MDESRCKKISIGKCYKCKTPWNITTPHSTHYNKTNGCFPLCERCWRELKPQQRLKYYEMLYKSWKKYDKKYKLGCTSKKEWEEIKKAVLNGK